LLIADLLKISNNIRSQHRNQQLNRQRAAVEEIAALCV
jgi:hypothetical protein